ncbi:class I SAM-dependent methyltransferase [Actinoplanes sp. TBRC 11911]|uniref:class I SAM-dependent methyltransferase n=1 Tax=Actinoplanes sp. TBRC 11911 TaxID=2729386 RepID=UPI00145D2A9C|nr:class I SAM-dependent methyltransferase [Actinoplanes sp. TBRC 11911]NMO52422.1 class I SAM-dependent methyltransferase [Actinoplanes sp. TBRC 11911]
MSWRKYTLIPRLMWLSLGAPRAQNRAWERYWQGIGSDGEVLWETDEPAERELLTTTLRRYADLSLPIVDLGCGSGRHTTHLAELSPRVVGVDGSAAAIAHAGPGDFRVADITEPGLGASLHAELGDANVRLRGVLHLLDDAARRAAAANIADLLGGRGSLYLCETDHAGDPLDLLYAQGARLTGLPRVVDRLVRSGVRPPRRFTETDLGATFPSPPWRILQHGTTEMYGVPLTPGGPIQRLPARYAVVRAPVTR